MATYLMFGRYSPEALKGIGPRRTEKAAAAIKKCRGRLESGYALLGAQDLLLITEFAEMEHAMKASLELSRLTGIAFSTSPAVSVEAFDKLVG